MSRLHPIRAIFLSNFNSLKGRKEIYFVFNILVAKNKDAVPVNPPDLVEHNPAYNISAALTYTAQLINVLAFYFNVRLPYRMVYRYEKNSNVTDKIKIYFVCFHNDQRFLWELHGWSPIHTTCGTTQRERVVLVLFTKHWSIQFEGMRNNPQHIEIDGHE